MLQNPPHILVVDDDEEVRALIAEYLGQGGLQVSLAGDADEARRVLMAKSIDLAVVDLVMPGENGLSLTRFIRERLEIGVVMLTSADDPVDRIVGLAVGADDYLAKPFHPRELLMRVRAVLHRLGERASAAVAAKSPAALTFGRIPARPRRAGFARSAWRTATIAALGVCAAPRIRRPRASEPQPAAPDRADGGWARELVRAPHRHPGRAGATQGRA